MIGVGQARQKAGEPVRKLLQSTMREIISRVPKEWQWEQINLRDREEKETGRSGDVLTMDGGDGKGREH